MLYGSRTRPPTGFLFRNAVSKLDFARRAIALNLRGMHQRIPLCTVKDGKQFLRRSTHYTASIQEGKIHTCTYTQAQVENSLEASVKRLKLIRGRKKERERENKGRRYRKKSVHVTTCADHMKSEKLADPRVTSSEASQENAKKEQTRTDRRTGENV